jgi:putative transposase
MRQHKTVADCRKDFQHKAGTDISKNHAFVVVEALKVKNMSTSVAGTAEPPAKMSKQKAGWAEQSHSGSRLALVHSHAEK